MKRCSIDSTPQIELSYIKAMCRDHGVKSYEGVTCKGHLEGVYKLPGVISIYKWTEFNSSDSLRIKRRCQLVVRLKTIKYKDNISRYLSSSICLVTSDLCYQRSNLWPFDLWYNITIIFFRFVLIISLCLYCFGRITNCITYIALAVSLIVSLLIVLTILLILLF